MVSEVRNVGPHPWDTVYEDVAVADGTSPAAATSAPAEAIVFKAQRAPSHVYQDRSHFVRIMSRLVRYQAEDEQKATVELRGQLVSAHSEVCDFAVHPPSNTHTLRAVDAPNAQSTRARVYTRPCHYMAHSTANYMYMYMWSKSEG